MLREEKVKSEHVEFFVFICNQKNFDMLLLLIPVLWRRQRA